MPRSITKNDNLFLELLHKGIEGKATAQEREMVKVALQAFMREPQVVRLQALAKIQAVSVSTDFERLVTNAFNVTIAEDNFDLGWQAAFNEVPRDANQDFWEMADITNGLTFKKILEGERVEVDTVKGSKVNVYVDYYGGALGITDRAIRFRKLAQVYEAARIFRNKFFSNQADNHYLLLAAAAVPANVIAYQGTGADSRVQRTILTINRGAFAIGDRNKDKGYGDMANAGLILYANPLDRERIEAAFVVTSGNLAAGVQQGTAITSQQIRRIYTYNANIVAGAPLLVLPGNKNQRNEAMAPTTYVAPADVLTLNQVQAVWSIYGAAVGDTDQVFKLTLS